MKEKFIIFVMVLLVNPMFSQLAINVTPSGSMTVKYLGCDPCSESYKPCLDIVECRAGCESSFDFEEAKTIEEECLDDCYFDNPSSDVVIHTVMMMHTVS